MINIIIKDAHIYVQSARVHVDLCMIFMFIRHIFYINYLKYVKYIFL